MAMLSSHKRHKITQASGDVGYAADVRSCLSILIYTPPSSTTCIQRNRQARERERKKERKKEENERASEQVCSNKEKSGKKGERREKGVDGASTRQSRVSWPPCFKMSSAFVYQGKFAPTIGQIAQKGDLFSVSYLRSLSSVSVRFFFVVHRLDFFFFYLSPIFPFLCISFSP